jgi:hypothetical protein
MNGFIKIFNKSIYNDITIDNNTLFPDLLKKIKTIFNKSSELFLIIDYIEYLDKNSRIGKLTKFTEDDHEHLYCKIVFKSINSTYEYEIRRIGGKLKDVFENKEYNSIILLKKIKNKIFKDSKSNIYLNDELKEIEKYKNIGFFPYKIQNKFLIVFKEKEFMVINIEYHYFSTPITIYKFKSNLKQYEIEHTESTKLF